jgi:tetratricopeptide (TPR) repeat protein
MFSKMLTNAASPLAARAAGALAVFLLAFQSVRARMHALDYMDDLVFWRATARAVPGSAKAHLNYGVMLGARGKLEPRLVENRRAMEIAPMWPMARIYYADTLCRLNRTEEAWPFYRQGIILAPNDRNLIALALQCLWEHNAILNRDKELLTLADKQPGSWLAWLCRDVVVNGPRNNGVDKKYRPRGYDEGPTE